MSKLLSSKKFVPVYFIVGILSAILFYFLDFSFPIIVLLSGQCMMVGLIFWDQHYNKKRNKT